MSKLRFDMYQELKLLKPNEETTSNHSTAHTCGKPKLRSEGDRKQADTSDFSECPSRLRFKATEPDTDGL